MSEEMQRKQAEVLALNFIRAVGGLFTYLPSYVVSLLTAVLSDVYMTTFAITGVAIGLASNWAVGLAAFFVIYSVARVWGNHTNAVALAGREVSGGVQAGAVQLGYAIQQAAQQEIEAPPVP